MKLATPELLLDARAFLGEGPAWDFANQRLYWLDIFAGHLHIYHPTDGADQVIPLGQPVGCAAPARNGQLILGLKQGLALLEPASAALTFLAQPESHLPGNRFNDGKCAPNGHFLAGSMDNAELEASGSLYSLNPDGTLKTLLSGVSISNGLAWSPDHKTLYYIDTPTRQVVAYDYDLGSGAIANPRAVITVPAALGWPDGMTSDASGRLWVALWGGAALTVWDPSTGALLEKIPMPAKNITSCVFGGAQLDELYVTSALKGLDESELRAYPANGGLFRIRTGQTGMPTFVFGETA
jgi:sugar lactone lactonase YvrE